MESIGFFSPVYVQPRKTSKDLKIALEPSLWQKYVVNSAEFIFNFGKESYRISPKNLKETRIASRIPTNTKLSHNLCQGITLLAATILFPVGLLLLSAKIAHHWNGFQAFPKIKPIPTIRYYSDIFNKCTQKKPYPILRDFSSIRETLIKEKTPIAKFINGSIALMLDITHIDKGTQPNYKRTLKTTNIVALIFDNNGKKQMPRDACEKLCIEVPASPERAKKEADEWNQLYAQQGIEKHCEPVLIKEHQVNLFSTFFGTDNTFLDAKKTKTFIETEAQDQLPAEDLNSISWLLLRLQAGKNVKLAEFSVHSNLWLNESIPNAPGYYDIRLSNLQ